MTIDISDGDLAATGTDVTEQQNLLSSNPNTGARPSTHRPSLFTRRAWAT